jgi:energy-converting hydrogenase Eha subunit G
MSSDDLLETVSLPLSDGERIIHVSRWSKAGMIAQMLLVALPLAVVALVLIFEGGSVPGVGVLFAIFALAAYAVAYQSWNKRRAILTTKQVIFFAGLSDTTKRVPLERIEQVSNSTGSVSIRSGSVFNTLTLNVPDAEALTAKIESARALRVSHAPEAQSP